MKKLLFVMPESAGDVFLCTALLRSLRETYPEYEIYFATKPIYFDILKDNKNIDKIIEYRPEMDNIFAMEGVADHNGYFDICLIPHIQTQRIITYTHNGIDRIALNLKY